ETGDPRRPLTRLRLVLVRRADRGASKKTRTIDERVAEAYAGAAVFVSRYIEGLRAGGHELPPLWAASRTVQDLVDVESIAPLRMRALAGNKRPGEDYWGFHAANVA